MLVAEVDRLREHLNLPEREIIAVLAKMSADDAEKLWNWLEGECAAIAREIFAKSVHNADPVGTAHRYLDSYRVALGAALRVEPSRAATLARKSFAAPNVLKRLRALIRAGPRHSRWTALLIAAAVSAGLVWQEAASVPYGPPFPRWNCSAVVRQMPLSDPSTDASQHVLATSA
jgi:hypothetical protein